MMDTEGTLPSTMQFSCLVLKTNKEYHQCWLQDGEHRVTYYMLRALLNSPMYAKSMMGISFLDSNVSDNGSSTFSMVAQSMVSKHL